MIEKVRKAFNEGFKQEFYENLQQEIVDSLGEPSAFRIAETPVFIDKELKNEVFSACEAIIAQLGEMDFQKIRDRFIPKEQQSKTPMGNPHFLAIDFGLCDDGNGGIVPPTYRITSFSNPVFLPTFFRKGFLKKLSHDT